jgi:hypothetical protein
MVPHGQHQSERSDLWNQIAAAKTLEKVRELQAAGTGKISADTLTNIYFFIASWRKE